MAENYHLPVVKDTSISSVDKEQIGNNGKSAQLKLKGIQEYILFDVELSDLKGFIVDEAWLHFKSGSPVKAPIKRAGISTLASDWVEGNKKGLRSETGSSCFVQAQYQGQDWSYPGSTLMDVVFARGNTVWASSEASAPEKDGWQKVRMSADILAARIAGISRGFCLYDDVGSEWEEKDGGFTYEYFPNRMVYSRENRGNEPWIEVTVKGRDMDQPDAVGEIHVRNTDLPEGETFLYWDTPSDKGNGKVQGFDVSWAFGDKQGEFPRYLIPMAKKAGEPVMMHVRDMGFKAGQKIRILIKSVDAAGNRSSSVSKDIVLSKGFELVNVRPSGVKPFESVDQPLSDSKINVFIVDLLDKYIPDLSKPYAGSNHIFSKNKNRIRLHGAKNEDLCFQIYMDGDYGNISIDCRFDDTSIVPVIYQFEHVAVDQHRFKTLKVPDPLIPINETDQTSLKRNPSYLCEIYVPHETRSGIKKGKLLITSGNNTLEMDVDLTIWDFALPDKLSFVPEMNAYSVASPYKGYAYYRLAHRHRTCLNRLPYGWNGLPEFAPVVTDQGFDFKEWDEKIGPLVDGSAFSDLPRKNQPVDIFYLPFSENWPVSLSGHYQKSWWAEEALSAEYKNELKTKFTAFVMHIRDKAWNRTQFQFYLNNKVYYREKYDKSSAPWIFDEPVNIQDFMALKWYGSLWHEAVDSIKGNTWPVFRGDISYSQYGRDILWGICDIEYLGGNNIQKTRMKRDELVHYPGAQFAEYGTANKLLDSNTQPVLWQLSAWAKGASGVLPWQTIGSDTCWEKGEQTALFYPKGDRVYPSVRLKAFRHGQQMVEYLYLLAKHLEVSQDAVRYWLMNQMAANEVVVKSHKNDAGTLIFRDITIRDLWQLRMNLGEIIHGIKSGLMDME